jgi:hypothetical protein
LIWRAAIVLGVVGGTASASDEPSPPPPQSFSREVVSEIRRLVDAAIVARPPTLVPPKPIAIKWKLGKLATIDLGAPLVALEAADLDGDGKSELYALTTRDVIALSLDGGKLRERSRVALTGDRATSMPRDIVGTLSAEAGAIVASLSPYARSVRVSWKKAALASEPGPAGFAVCPGELVQLVPGRNYFGDATNAFYGVRCTNALVDNDGYPLRARATLSLAGKLDIGVERCAAPGLGCQPAARHEYINAGVAFAVDDLDRDGKPEIIYAAAVPAGELDAVRVSTLGTDDKQARLKRSFTGGVAAIAIAELGGKGTREAIVASRVAGTTKVELWRIE